MEVITVWERLDLSRIWEDEEELPWQVPHEQLIPGWSHSRNLPRHLGNDGVRSPTQKGFSPQRGAFSRGAGHLNHTCCPPSMPMADSTSPSSCLAFQASREGTRRPTTGTLLSFPHNSLHQALERVQMGEY